MKHKTQRLLFVIFGGLCLFGAAAIILTVFRDNLVFFYSPTEIKNKELSKNVGNERIRVGGLVEKGSIKNKEGDITVEFRLTDLDNSLEVKYRGLLPPMFREGQGIVAEGYLNDKTFKAETLLTKHDENYMPPEVAEALKKSGKWQGSP